MIQSRLKSLIEYAQQSALLRLSPQTEVSRHGIFTEVENSIRDLPGIHLNPQTNEDSDEIWLVVDRLQESPAPIPDSILLKTWAEISNSLTKEPSLLSHIEAEKLGSGPIEMFTKQEIGDSILSVTAGGMNEWIVLAERPAMGEA